MPKTAWRCSQCGTVNEADARACRQCGKWPSLFDLQDGAVDVAELEADAEQAMLGSPFEFEPETIDPEAFEPGAEGEAVEPKRRFPGWLITVAVIVGWFLWYLIGSLVLPD